MPGNKGAADKGSDGKHYIGFVIGVLSVVILMLVAAIIFIVIRNQRIKSSPIHSVLPASEKRTDVKVRIFYTYIIFIFLK